jgi:hypothetical protein
LAEIEKAAEAETDCEKGGDLVVCPVSDCRMPSHESEHDQSQAKCGGSEQAGATADEYANARQRDEQTVRLLSQPNEENARGANRQHGRSTPEWKSCVRHGFLLVVPDASTPRR